MAWNPDTYNQFKSERFAPFYDLLELVEVKPGLQVIDLGCGTGELAKKLSDHLPGSTVLGIDSSKEMLKDSTAFENEQLRFECSTIEAQVNKDKKWDLVFSNAALQWVDDHITLLPKIIATIKTGGQLAIQIPDQQQNSTNKLLEELAGEAPFNNSLQNWKRTSPVLDMGDYARLLFENGAQSITVFEKVYPLILPGTDALFDWVSGTALIPYLERLEPPMQQQFTGELKARLKKQFPATPVFYPFKRILMAAGF